MSTNCQLNEGNIDNDDDTDVDLVVCGTIAFGRKKYECVLHCLCCNTAFERVAELKQHIACQIGDALESENNQADNADGDAETDRDVLFEEEVVMVAQPERGNLLSLTDNQQVSSSSACENSSAIVSSTTTHSVFRRRRSTRALAKQNMSFVCSICGQALVDPQSIKKHIASHGTKRVNICPLCGTNFAITSNLNLHICRHLGIKEHCCTICNANFVSLSELKLHTRIHTGETPFQCYMCGKLFRCASNLNAHCIRNHQKKEK